MEEKIFLLVFQGVVQEAWRWMRERGVARAPCTSNFDVRGGRADARAGWWWPRA
jgi:hypothetical protein